MVPSEIGTRRPFSHMYSVYMANGHDNNYSGTHDGSTNLQGNITR